VEKSGRLTPSQKTVVLGLLGCVENPTILDTRRQLAELTGTVLLGNVRSYATAK